jgi:C-terminal processing protease CtpA/Prc
MSSSRLSADLKAKVISFGETSYGACRVALVMSDGGIIEDVIVAWGDEVVRINGVDVADFDGSQVVDAIDRR